MTDTPRQNILCRLFNCVHPEVEWISGQLKSACPPKKEKPRKRCTGSKLEKIEGETDIGPPCIEKRSYILPSQICPKTKACCYIKMQDPYSPCCCETMKSELPPCPKHRRRQPRELICDCDLCKRKCTSKHKCCN